MRDMDYLGKDFISALNSAKERTSSELFKEFIDGLILVFKQQGHNRVHKKQIRAIPGYGRDGKQKLFKKA